MNHTNSNTNSTMGMGMNMGGSNNTNNNLNINMNSNANTNMSTTMVRDGNTNTNMNGMMGNTANHNINMNAFGSTNNMNINNMNMNVTGDKELFAFLINAPKEFREGEKIRKFQLKNGDYIHCVLWNMHFYITGTDIVKILVWRFQNAGRQLASLKKFEEGVFSDLRNLKPGIDAALEGPRSDFLEFLYKNGCIRTQKKQKVFYWYSVPHDALFCDALERDLRRETNLFTYSKYMNNIASHNFVESVDPYCTQPVGFGRPVSTLKKKPSVKVAARNKRTPKELNMYNPFNNNGQIGSGLNSSGISNGNSSDAMKNSFNNKYYGCDIIPSLDDPTFSHYDAFNPTQPDPFMSYGPSIPDINFGYDFDESYRMATPDFGTFNGGTGIIGNENNSMNLNSNFNMTSNQNLGLGTNINPGLVGNTAINGNLNTNTNINMGLANKNSGTNLQNNNSINPMLFTPPSYYGNTEDNQIKRKEDDKKIFDRNRNNVYDPNIPNTRGAPQK